MTPKEVEDQLSALYDEVYEEAILLFKEYNPCRIKYGVCEAARIRKAKYNEPKLPLRKVSFCCKGCEYLSKTGCTTKALSCKLWICMELVDTVPQDFIHKLNKLRAKAGLLYYGVRQCKEDAINMTLKKVLVPLRMINILEEDLC